MTHAERHLWGKLRNRQLAQLKFRRQHPCGPFAVDFYCPTKRIVVEVDGGQHYSPQGQSHDKHREEYLKQRGLTVLRYSDKEVLTNIKGVLQNILNRVHDM